MPQLERLSHVILCLTLYLFTRVYVGIPYAKTTQPSKCCFCLFVTHTKFMVEGEGVIPDYPSHDGKDIIDG